jgi:radical SAM family uncharacterized protein
MMTPSEIQLGLNKILLKVSKPGRYVGGEMNTISKEWTDDLTSVALVFPDIYDIGISNVGLKILYDQVNMRADALAERAYAPWRDMEEQMRANSIPLYSLETFHPLAEFDLIGFSLPYETLYTNTLNILDMAGIPVKSVDRDESHPLIIGGGHSTMNPEPMHAFMDAFVIGEGEEVIHDIINTVKRLKPSFRPAGMRTHKTRDKQTLLEELAKIPGVYVPALYTARYFPDGTIESVTPQMLDVPEVVVKRMVAKLPPPPTTFIVPNIEAVHNRVSIEIMRGCTRGCRFCHAGMINRPVRERSVQEIIKAADEAIRSTGFEEIALLSLSSSDYTQILELVTAMGTHFAEKHLAISLPSLRIETVSVDLMDKLRDRRGTGFTLAPEAATERMRRIINKFIPDEQLLETVREIYRRGWVTVKLYFMIGHPSETLEDVQAIADLCKRVLAEGRKVIGYKARVHAGVSTFVPKPQTPFQWVACDTVEQITLKQNLLKRELRDKNIKLSWTPPEDTMLEAWLARGDRRISEVIYTAWKNGARFDAWQEERRFSSWLAAFEQCGLDANFYTHRPRRTDEIFPWDHITAAVRKNFLFQDFRQSLEGKIRVDCRQQCFACGILPTFKKIREENPGDYWKCPEIKSRSRQAEPSSPILVL